MMKTDDLLPKNKIWKGDFCLFVFGNMFFNITLKNVTELQMQLKYWSCDFVSPTVHNFVLNITD